MSRLSKQNKNIKPKRGYKFIDDYTGFEEHSSKAVKDWRGFYTTAKHVDQEHPQEKFTPKVREQKPLPFTRPDQDPTYVDSTQDYNDSEY